MITSGRTIFLSPTIGFFIILISISTQLKANNDIKNYIKLGEEFYQSNQFFLSYQNYSSAFLLEKDSDVGVVYGLKALESCLNVNRLPEGKWLIGKLSLMEGKKDYYDSLLSLLYLKNNNVKKANDLLKNLYPNRDNIKLLNAYSLFLSDNYNESREVINSLSLENENINSLKQSFNVEPVFKKKSPILAGILSGIIPGAGQLYTGHTFDAINSITMTGLLGATSGILWYYEMDREHSDRNYFLPSISTVLFSVFYVTNIYNSVNSANRYNSFSENQYYGSILDKFRIIINDSVFFVGFRFK